MRHLKLDVDAVGGCFGESGGWTLLHYAAHGGSAPIVRRLLGMRAEAAAQNRRLQTPLHLAAANGRDRAVDALIQYFRRQEDGAAARLDVESFDC